MSTEQKLSFEIRTLEWITQNRPEQIGIPRRPGCFEILWIKNASGTYFIDLEKHVIHENMVYCIDAGQLRVLQADKGMVGYYLSFSPQFLYLSGDTTWPLFETDGYTRTGMARTVAVDKELQVEMEEIMGKMIKEFANDSLLQSEILKGLLRILMIYLSRRFCTKKSEMAVNRNDELVKRFMALLENNIKKKKMVFEFAGELGVTPNYLNEIVKKVTGQSAKYHIQQRKVLEAKRQVIYYGISMKEIAYDLGFDDLAHFSKFFKTNTGSSFQNFRKGIQANYQL